LSPPQPAIVPTSNTVNTPVTHQRKSIMENRIAGKTAGFRDSKNKDRLITLHLRLVHFIVQIQRIQTEQDLLMKDLIGRGVAIDQRLIRHATTTLRWHDLGKAELLNTEGHL
jgi:hypothetical protein